MAIAGLEPLPIIIVVGVGLVTPVFLYSSAKLRRGRELELALPLALQQVANEMAAGATLQEAL